MESESSSSNHGYCHVPSTSSGRVPTTTSDKFSENPKTYSAGLRALVVDSNPASRKFISSMLSDNKYEVVAVETATEALTFISQRKNELDLVLTEFNLPDMDGIEFLQRFKRESKLPLVFLSSEMREEVKIHCLSKGASVYLEKPLLARDVKNLWQFTVFNRYNNSNNNKNNNNKRSTDATAAAPVENVNKRKSVQKSKGGSSSEMVGDNFRYPVSMRPKMTWTEELHLKFVDAVNTLGFHFARPRMILKHMNVPGLTATNVSSHLQKYRISVKQRGRQKSSSPEIATPGIQNNNDGLIYSGKFGSSSSQVLPGSNNSWQREVPQIQKPPPPPQQLAATTEPGYKVQFKSNLPSNASLVTPPNSVQLLNQGMLSAAKSASEGLEVHGGLTTLRSHQLGSSPYPTNYVGPRICVNQRGDQRIKFGKPNESNGDQAVQMINMALLSGGGACNSGIGSVNNTSPALLSNPNIGGTGNTGSVKNSTTSLAQLNNSIGGGGNFGNTGSVKNSISLLNNSIGGDSNFGNLGNVENSISLALLNNSVGGDGNPGNVGTVKDSTSLVLLNNSIGSDGNAGNIGSVKNSIIPALLNNLIGGDSNSGNIGSVKNSTSLALLNNSTSGDSNSGNIENGLLNNSVRKQLGLGGLAPILSVRTPTAPTPAPALASAPATAIVAHTLAPTSISTVVAPTPTAPPAVVAPAVVAPASTSALPSPAVVAPPMAISAPQQEQDGNKGCEEFNSELFDLRNSPIPDLFGQEEFDDLSFLWSSSS